MTALALEARPHAHLLQSRQDQDGPLSRDRAHQGRSQRRDRRPQGSRVGRGHRQLGLRAAPCAAVGGVAGAEGEAVRVRVVDLGVPELQRAARRIVAGRKTRRRDRRESRRRNLRAAEGAVRTGRREGPARPHHDHPPGAHRRARRQHRSLHLLAGARGARRRVHRAGRAHAIRSRSSTCATSRRSRSTPSRRDVTGTYNLVSQRQRVQVRRAHRRLHRRGAASRSKPADAPRATYLPTEFLEEQKVEPWSEMPVWLPAKGDEAAFAGTSNKAARAKGLKITPIRKTVNDTLAWHLTRPEEERAKLKSGIAPEKEAKCSRRGRRGRLDVGSPCVRQTTRVDSEMGPSRSWE